MPIADHGHSQRSIGARLNGSPEIRLLRCHGIRGINHYELSAIIPRCHQVLPAIERANGGIAPPDKRRMRIHLVFSAVAHHVQRHSQHLPGIVEHGHVVFLGNLRSSQAVEQPHVHVIVLRIGAGTVGIGNGRVAELLLVLFPVIANVLDGIIPAQTFPLTATARSAFHATRRVLDAFWRIDALSMGVAACANEVFHGIFVQDRPRFHHFALTHRNRNAAATSAVAAADALVHLFLGLLSFGRSRQRIQRHPRHSRRSRCGGCGLQERSAGEPPSRRVLQHGARFLQFLLLHSPSSLAAFAAFILTWPKRGQFGPRCLAAGQTGQKVSKMAYLLISFDGEAS